MGVSCYTLQYIYIIFRKKRGFLNNSFGVQLLNDVAGDAKFRTQGASIIFSRGLNLIN